MIGVISNEFGYKYFSIDGARKFIDKTRIKLTWVLRVKFFSHHHSAVLTYFLFSDPLSNVFLQNRFHNCNFA